MMSFEEFCKYVEENIINLMGDHKIESLNVKDINKNNGVVLKGLTIVQKGTNVHPTLYLDYYYEDMKDYGISKERILEKIAKDYENVLPSVPSIDVNTMFNEKNIVAMLVNRERNFELFKTLIHVAVNDSLAIIFKYAIMNEGNIDGYVSITHEMAEMKGLDANSLLKHALINTPNILGCNYLELSSLAESMFKDKDDELYSLLKDNEVPLIPMIAITNNDMYKGAFTFFLPGVREKFVSRFECDFVLLPNSIHETIAVPLNDDVDLDYLQNMVTEVNKKAVNDIEILDDKPYVIKQDGSDEISKFIASCEALLTS